MFDEKYREYLKKNHPDRLAATIWVNGMNGEMVLYSEHATEIINAIAKVEGA